MDIEISLKITLIHHFAKFAMFSASFMVFMNSIFVFRFIIQVSFKYLCCIVCGGSGKTY